MLHGGIVIGRRVITKQGQFEAALPVQSTMASIVIAAEFREDRRDVGLELPGLRFGGRDARGRFGRLFSSSYSEARNAFSSRNHRSWCTNLRDLRICYREHN